MRMVSNMVATLRLAEGPLVDIIPPEASPLFTLSTASMMVASNMVATLRPVEGLRVSTCPPAVDITVVTPHPAGSPLEVFLHREVGIMVVTLPLARREPTFRQEASNLVAIPLPLVESIMVAPLLHPVESSTVVTLLPPVESIMVVTLLHLAIREATPSQEAGHPVATRPPLVGSSMEASRMEADLKDKLLNTSLPHQLPRPRRPRAASRPPTASARPAPTPVPPTPGLVFRDGRSVM